MKYTDPDGRKIRSVGNLKQTESTGSLGSGTTPIASEGCTLTIYVRMAIALGANTTLDEANDYAVRNNLFSEGKDGEQNLLTQEAGAALVNGLVNDPAVKVVYDSSASGITNQLAVALNGKENEKAEYFTTARLETGNAEKTKTYGHSVSVNRASVFFTGLLEKIGGALEFKYNDTSNTNRTGTSDTSRHNDPQRVDFFRIEKQNWAMMENK